VITADSIKPEDPTGHTFHYVPIRECGPTEMASNVLEEYRPPLHHQTIEAPRQIALGGLPDLMMPAVRPIKTRDRGRYAHPATSESGDAQDGLTRLRISGERRLPRAPVCRLPRMPKSAGRHHLRGSDIKRENLLVQSSPSV
jgi:hypothetical protein